MRWFTADRNYEYCWVWKICWQGSMLKRTMMTKIDEFWGWLTRRNWMITLVKPKNAALNADSKVWQYEMCVSCELTTENARVPWFFFFPVGVFLIKMEGFLECTRERHSKLHYRTTDIVSGIWRDEDSKGEESGVTTEWQRTLSSRTQLSSSEEEGKRNHEDTTTKFCRERFAFIEKGNTRLSKVSGKTSDSGPNQISLFLSLSRLTQNIELLLCRLNAEDTHKNINDTNPDTNLNETAHTSKNKYTHVYEDLTPFCRWTKKRDCIFFLLSRLHLICFFIEIAEEVMDSRTLENNDETVLCVGWWENVEWDCRSIRFRLMRCDNKL